MFNEEKKVTLDDLEKLVNLFHNGSQAFALQYFRRLGMTEKLYVGLAANRLDLLGGKPIAYALGRIGSKWQREIIVRHQYD